MIDMTKIIYDDNNKNSILNNINNCVNILNDINNNFYNTFFPRDFYYFNSLYNLECSMKKLKTDLCDYKTNFNNYINRINKNEIELSNIINKIDDIHIKNIDL